MIMHVLKKCGIDFDYLVGAQIDGFENMVRISGSDLLVVEADEYPSSCLDDRAKMLHYKPDISIITGIAWDHINIYKTYEDYKSVFDLYFKEMNNSAVVYFDQTDSDLNQMMINNKYACLRNSYQAASTNKSGNIIFEDEEFPISIFGEHNLKNLEAARNVCRDLGIGSKTFLSSIADFKGAAKRLEYWGNTNGLEVYRDFAHAPSKVKATVKAIRQKYKHKKLAVLLELHTFSSLNIDFIKLYNKSLNEADMALVFFDPKALEMKKMPELDPLKIHELFETSQ